MSQDKQAEFNIRGQILAGFFETLVSSGLFEEQELDELRRLADERRLHRVDDLLRVLGSE